MSSVAAAGRKDERPARFHNPFKDVIGRDHTVGRDDEPAGGPAMASVDGDDKRGSLLDEAGKLV